MGNPSDGKKFPPDKKCENCDTILIGDEVDLCDECNKKLSLPEKLAAFIKDGDKLAEYLYNAYDEDFKMDENIIRIVNRQNDLAAMIMKLNDKVDRHFVNIDAR